MSCALELLEAVLDPSPDNTYEARVLVDDADRVVAYGCYGVTPMTERAYDLYWLVTARQHRGKGHGRALLDGIEIELHRRGARMIRVETSSLEGQGGARRFYQHAGYEQVGLIRDFYRPADDLITLCKRM